MKIHSNKFYSATGIALLALGSGIGQAAPLPPGAASLTYSTPKTKLTLAGTLVLQRCVKEGVTATTSLALTSAGVADTAATFNIDGAYLSSALQKRELSIDLHESRTIKSINAASTDKTGAVVTSVLKVAASIVGAIAGIPPVAANIVSDDEKDRQEDEREKNRMAARIGSPCNERTLAALEVVDRLQEAIVSVRASLYGTDPDDAESIGEQIQLMATQIGQVTEQNLTVTLSAPFDVGNPEGSGNVATGGKVLWTLKDLNKWFGTLDLSGACNLERPADAGKYFTPTPASGRTDCESKSSLFAIDYKIAADVAAAMDRRPPASRCLPAKLMALPATTPAETKHRRSEYQDCGRMIMLATPVPATATFTVAPEAGSSFYGDKPGGKLGSAAIAVPQWGAVNYLPLNVGLFRSRTVGLTLDEFGRRQSFKWNSEATAENATAGVGTAVDAGLAVLRNAEGPTDTAKWTAESAEIEARMNRNKWRICETAIANGAAKCE